MKCRSPPRPIRLVRSFQGHETTGVWRFGPSGQLSLSDDRLLLLNPITRSKQRHTLHPHNSLTRDLHDGGTHRHAYSQIADFCSTPREQPYKRSITLQITRNPPSGPPVASLHSSRTITHTVFKYFISQHSPLWYECSPRHRSSLHSQSQAIRYVCT